MVIAQASQDTLVLKLDPFEASTQTTLEYRTISGLAPTENFNFLFCFPSGFPEPEFY